MSSKQTEKTAIVTGGASGIGHSICLRLASKNINVMVLDIDNGAAEKTVTEIRQQGGSAKAYAVDISNSKQVHDVIGKIKEKYRIDILVNNAGIACIGNVEKASEADLDRLYNINVKGLYNCIKASISIMKAQKNGVIINMASAASSVGIADRFAYSMSKGAVLAMTLSVAKDYVTEGIRCNCISPGRIHTPFVDNYLEENYADTKVEMFENLSKSQPIGRMGQPEEVAAMVEYLCSEEASFITGSNFPIDGGFVTLNS